MAKKGVKSSFATRRPYRALMAELGEGERVLDAVKGKVGNGVGFAVVTDERLIVVGQAVAALSAESTVESYPLSSITGVVLDTSLRQATLTISTDAMNVTVDNITAGSIRITKTLRAVTDAR